MAAKMSAVGYGLVAVYGYVPGLDFHAWCEAYDYTPSRGALVAYQAVEAHFEQRDA